MTPEFYINYTSHREQMPEGVKRLGLSENPFAMFDTDELHGKIAEFKKDRWLKNIKTFVRI